MVFSKTCPADGKPRYIKKFGGIILLTKDKKGALEDLPEGWEIFETENGYLRIKRK
jgi:hypothetical protein